MKVIFIFAIAVVVVALAKEIEEEEWKKVARKALYNPNLFEGDIAGPSEEERNAIKAENYRWPYATIPYVIDGWFNQGSVQLITGGMNYISSKTCVKFRPANNNDRDFVHIFSHQGCYSMVGKMGGKQMLSLGNGCLYHGIVIHELIHAIGFYHEQSRSDRDNYLHIYLKNVDQSMHHNFQKLHPNQNLLLGPFDYASIMIYGNYAFSKNGYYTMEAKNGQRLIEPYEKNSMTNLDIMKINKMYNCR